MAQRIPPPVAALADQRLRATPAQLCDAVGVCTTLHPVQDIRRDASCDSGKRTAGRVNQRILSSFDMVI